MDIAAISMSMSSAKLQSDVATSVMKLNMDTQKDLAGNVMTELMDALPAAQTGHIDISV